MIVQCAVCENELEEREAFATLDDDGDLYFLCGNRCLEEFEREPERFSAWAVEEQEAAAQR